MACDPDGAFQVLVTFRDLEAKSRQAAVQIVMAEHWDGRLDTLDLESCMVLRRMRRAKSDYRD